MKRFAQFIFRLGLALFVVAAVPSARATVCFDTACVVVSGRLASVDSTRSVLLNALMGQLLGSQTTLSAGDWQAVANAQVNLLDVLQVMQASASLATPQDALTTSLDAVTVFNATASALSAKGNTAAASAVSGIAARVGTGAIRLGDLLDVCSTCVSYADIQLNVLDLVGGSASLFNYNYAAATPTPIGITGASIGQLATIASIQFSAVVLDAPKIICRTSGAQFYGSAIRLKLDTNLVNVDLTSAVTAKLSALGLSLTTGASGLHVQLAHLGVFASISKTQGLLQSVDAVTQAVNLQAIPGVVDLYLGAIDDSVFFDKNHTLSAAADLQFGTVGALQVTISVPIVGPTVAVTAAVRAKASATGQAPYYTSLNFTGPYQQQQTVSTSTTFVTDLTTSLLNNLQIDIQLSTPSTLATAVQVIFDLLVTLLKPVLVLVYKVAVVSPLNLLLASIANPALVLLGIRLGEADITVLGARRRCTYTVSGSVYRDSNRNGFKDSTEAGTGLTLTAKLVAESAPGGPALASATVDPTTGAYSFTGVASGSYRIVIDDNATLSDVTATTAPAGWTAIEQSTLLRTGVVVVSDLPNQNFGLAPGSAISGRVFRDSGTTGGTANDGIRNGAEAASSGVTMKLLDAGSTVLDTVKTAGDGTYRLFIPSTVAAGAVLRVVETNPTDQLSTGAAVGTTSGTYDRTTDTLTFTYAAGVSYTGVDFGDVPASQLITDGQQNTAPGSAVYYQHQFIAGTAGQVTFSLTHTLTPSVTGWSEVVYLDANANGQIDAGETPITGAITVVEGQTLALIVKVFASTSAPYNARNQSVLRADLVFKNAAPAFTQTSLRTDLTIVGTVSTAGLTLVKTVDKAAAKPGDTIVYTVTFTNEAATPLHDVVVSDATPTFTRFASASTGSVPASLGIATLTAPGVGTIGTVRWTFTGTLAPAASGAVTFSVIIDQ